MLKLKKLYMSATSKIPGTSLDYWISPGSTKPNFVASNSILRVEEKVTGLRVLKNISLSKATLFSTTKLKSGGHCLFNPDFTTPRKVLGKSKLSKMF